MEIPVSRDAEEHILGGEPRPPQHERLLLTVEWSGLALLPDRDGQSYSSQRQEPANLLDGRFSEEPQRSAIADIIVLARQASSSIVANNQIHHRVVRTRADVGTLVGRRQIDCRGPRQRNHQHQHRSEPKVDDPPRPGDRGGDQVQQKACWQTRNASSILMLKPKPIRNAPRMSQRNRPSFGGEHERPGRQEDHQDQ